MAKLNESDGLWSSHLSQQGIPSAGDIKDFDDWSIISSSKKGVRVKKVTIYADYYLCAFEIEYQDKSGNVTTSTHAVDDSYLTQCNKIKKCELEIDEDDYIGKKRSLQQF